LLVTKKASLPLGKLAETLFFFANFLRPHPLTNYLCDYLEPWANKISERRKNQY